MDRYFCSNRVLLGAVFLFDQNNGVVMGQDGFAANTTNAGNSWNFIPIGTNVYY